MLPSAQSPSKRILVHLGCGPTSKPTAWQDYDGSWNLRINKLPKPFPNILRQMASRVNPKMYIWPDHIRYLELTKALPFAANSVHAIYASHVLEHLYLDEATAAIKECHRVLKPGSVLRLVVPNLRYYCQSYLANSTPDAAERLNRELLFRHTCRPKTLIGRMYAALTDFHSHKFMYDPEYLAEVVKRAGFIEVEERQFLVSRIPELSEVEKSSRVSETAGFAIEGLKRG